VLRVASNVTLTLAAETNLTCAEAAVRLLKDKRRSPQLSSARTRPRMPGTGWTGDAATKPAHAGSTSAHGSPETSKLPYQLAIGGCLTRPVGHRPGEAPSITLRNLVVSKCDDG
jgi:hypothetical protein